MAGYKGRGASGHSSTMSGHLVMCTSNFAHALDG